MLRKNVAGQFVYFAGVNATTGAALTGATFSGRRSIDGTFAAIGGTITEDTGTGFYKVALAQADTNGNDLAFFFTAANAVPVCMTVLTTAADPSNATTGGLGNLDAAVSSRLATAGYTAPDNTTIAAIAGYVDTEVGAIKAKTDQLAFTVANQVDVNVQSVNDAAVAGNGQPGTTWGPA